MDVKITKGRLVNLISYDFLKIILSILAGIMVWVLLFTTCATRATVGEQFGLILYQGVYSGSNDGKDFLTELKKKEKGGLSYDVLEYTTMSVTAAGNYSAAYMLSLKSATKEGDVIVFAGGNKTVVKDKDGKPHTLKIGYIGFVPPQIMTWDKANLSGKVTVNDITETARKYVPKISDDAQSIVNNESLYSVTDFLTSAHNYLNGNGLVKDGAVDEAAVRNYFLTVRMKSASNYRKTFRTETQKEEGVKKEIERITNLYANLQVVEKAINNAKTQGEDFLWYADRIIGGEIYKSNEPYGIDLNKLNAKKSEAEKKSITELWYTVGEVDGKSEATSEGLVLGVFDYHSDQADLQYEALAVIREVIETYSDYAD